MAAVTGTRRLLWTAVGFGAALMFVGLASATHSVIPVFVAWIPLLVVPWVLTRPEAPTTGTDRSTVAAEGPQIEPSDAATTDATGDTEPAEGNTTP
jgi:hypothetical protein